jgi:hypothetical protein
MWFILRVLPVLLVLFLALVFLLPAAFRSCLPEQSGQLVTRSKLQNLKVTMAQVSVLAVEGSITFPETDAELLDLLEREFGQNPSRAEGDPENPLVDGWGDLMRFKADEDYYEIRSSGADGIMDTPDDIYLLGDAAGEYLLDGEGRTSLTRQDFLIHKNPQPFQDPKGYYEIHLPGDYTVIRSTSGEHTEVVFSYARDMRVTVTAGPGTTGWQPQAELDKRLEMLRREEDEIYGGFSVTGYDLVSVAGASGYSLILEKGPVHVQEVRLLSPKDLEVTITLVASGADASPILASLDRAVRESLLLK